MGGGFHRYSVDHRWLVPHFEKMLYDNALFALIYTQTYQVTKAPLFARIANETLVYTLREMTSPEGGFYSTQDADSEGVEGKFFVWTKQEVVDLLGEEDGNLFCRYFDVTPEGNFEGKSILNSPTANAQEDFGVSAKHLSEVIEAGRKVLFEAREKRIKPGRDEKIQVNWNGLMISAFAQAYRAFDEPEYLKGASKAARFILDNMRTE